MTVTTIILEQIRSLGWIVKTFRVNGAIEITYTLLGDANLDGTVSTEDLHAVLD
jgi:hypothetical protein